MKSYNSKVTEEGIIPSLSIDCVIFGFENAELKVLLIRRAQEPEFGKWALPGGFVLEDEDLDQSARRILEELTGVSNLYMEQVHTFGELKRFPLRRVITIAYYALVKPEAYQLKPGPLATEVKWCNINTLPELPFDHKDIFDTSLQKLRRKVRYEPIGFELLPEKFTLTEIQQLYEATLLKKLDKRNFRKKLLKMNLLLPLDEIQQNVAHRAARLYSFDPAIYHSLKEKGFHFEI
ncbi:NUDIX domain-containing protein [Cytophagaceae bacterium ABcell3]|nr:NUDIX domain-containing protein [Cytophagaceae bacterium ABcell3]